MELTCSAGEAVGLALRLREAFFVDAVDIGDRRELRDASGSLVTEITYLLRKGKREPISIQQHVFHYHITIQYLGD